MEAFDFRVLLMGYVIDDGEINVVDFTKNERVSTISPEEKVDAGKKMPRAQIGPRRTCYWFPSCQKATALAAATFKESTPWLMGMRTV